MSMRKSEMFWWGVIAAVLAGMLAGGTFGFKYHAKLAKGYCPSEGRVLSQEKLMGDVVKEFVRGRETGLSKRLKLEKDTIRYSGVEEFYALNPNCCAIALATRKNVYASFLQIRYNSKVLGNKYYVILITYLNAAGQNKTTQKIIDVCGKRRDTTADGQHIGPNYLSTHSHKFRSDTDINNTQNNMEQ